MFRLITNHLLIHLTISTIHIQKFQQITGDFHLYLYNLPGRKKQLKHYKRTSTTIKKRKFVFDFHTTKEQFPLIRGIYDDNDTIITKHT